MSEEAVYNPLVLIGRGLAYAWKEFRSGLGYYDPQEQAWTPRILEMQPTRSGVAVSEVSGMKCLDVFACIRCISEDIAKLPLYLYERQQPRGQTQLRNHISDLLNKRPNPEMTAFDFKCTLMGHVLAWGNAFAEIEFNNDGTPRWIWPLPVDRMKVIRDPKNHTLRYECRPNYVDQPIPLEPWQVLHIKGLGFDGLVGYSPIRLAAENIGVDLAQTRFAASFFGNSAIPGVMLKHPMKLSEEAEKRLKKSWEDAFRGTDNSNRTVVLQEGLDVTKLTLKPEEAQFLESRQFSTEEICRLYRVPPHKIQHLLRSTNNNIEQQNIEYTTDCLHPWATRWEQECDVKMNLPQGQFFAHKFNELLRGDAVARSTYYSQMHNGGILNTNEIREEEGYNPVADGDELLVQGAMISLAAAIAAVPNAPAQLPGPDGKVSGTKPAKEAEPPPPAVSKTSETVPSGQKIKQKSGLDLAKIAENHALLLAETLSRALKIERSHAEKWAKKADFDGQKQAFYAGHRAVLRGLIRPIVHNLAACVSGMGNPDVVCEEICQRHIAESETGLSMATVDSAVLGWTEARAQREAKMEVEKLLEVLTHEN